MYVNATTQKICCAFLILLGKNIILIWSITSFIYLYNFAKSNSELKSF